MSIRVLTGSSILLTLVLAGCGSDSSSPPSHSPTHLVIVSGANQSGDVSAALATPLVVQALDGSDKSVSGVSITWTVVGGGTVSPATSSTDADGKASVTWTLSPTAGNQIVTATSSQIPSASASFVANNGATISGTITAVPGLPFGASFSRSLSHGPRLTTVSQTVTRHPSASRIVIGFKSAAIGIAAAGAGDYRSMTTARDASTRLQSRVAALTKGMPVGRAEISPAILAARLRVTDTSKIEATMAALRADPSVEWVERDAIISIRDGAPRPKADIAFANADRAVVPPSASVALKFPSDPGLRQQLWGLNMVDLPRAWSITTGSPNVIVASVDMGIRFDHPDITAALTNDGYDFVSSDTFDSPETMCDGNQFNSINGDGDGPDADPTDPDDLEFNGFLGCWDHNTLGDHGLWTAGIIGAVGNDGVGGAGVAWSVKIRPIRVLGITGDGSDFDIAQGVLYAAGLPATGANNALVQAQSRAPIINMSLGGPGRSTALRNAVNAAIAAGSLIVASAGNDGLDLPSYPAAYDGVMAVAAVGEDGLLATYSNGGSFISVAAPGGDFRFDDNGGGGVYGPGWDFTSATPLHLFGYGTSGSAPYVSGIAALLLAQTPSLTAAQLRARIEQFATRPAGASRSDSYGWGIANAYNALTQQNGPPRATLVRLVDATSGATRASITANNGTFTFSRVPNGSYYVQAGEDESGDGVIGSPGRRFAWAGGFGTPTVFNVNNNAQSTAIALGVPSEVEPNDDVAHANSLSVGSYVTGNITLPDVRDLFRVTIATAGVYTVETSGLVGSCGLGIELDTFITLTSSAGAVIGSNDNFTSTTSRLCSRIQMTLQPGIYYVTVSGTAANGFADHGRYRLEVRSGT
jgi:hypothetical protein